MKFHDALKARYRLMVLHGIIHLPRFRKLRITGLGGIGGVRLAGSSGGTTCEQNNEQG